MSDLDIDLNYILYKYLIFLILNDDIIDLFDISNKEILFFQFKNYFYKF